MAALFDRLVDLPPGEREAILEAECAGDPDLRREVEALLLADAGSQEAPIEREVSADLVQESQHLGLLGQTIDGFRITGVLGSGGMGTVFAAEQDRPRRMVAWKTMRLGFLSTAARRRFEYESEVLGRLRHPGIAQVYAAGAWREPVSGQELPYFALELIEGGRPLDQFVVEQGLALGATLELFLQVCDAVQHGHQRGVVHRDLKPGNVLVEPRGRPKVIDFGIARVTEAAGQVTQVTEAGQVIGTLQYMAPEQVTGDPAAVDLRADVYALGVVLYELLAGRPPIDTRTTSLAVAMVRVQDVEPPPPSASDKGLASGGLPLELDWITAKALAKDPAERYASVSELAADLRRLLADEPVSVGPPSTGYRLRKFVRRHRLAVGAAAAVVLALMIGIVGTTWQMLVAGRARDEAQRQAKRVTNVNDFYNVILGFGDPFERRKAGSGPDVTMREAITGAAELLDSGELKTLSADPEIEADIRYTLGNSFKTWGDRTAARRHFERALELRRGTLGPRDVQVAEVVNVLGQVAQGDGDLAGAAQLYREAIDIYRAQDPPDNRRIATALTNLAGILPGDESVAAAALLEEAIERFERAAGGASGLGATAMSHLARLRQRNDDVEGAVAMCRRSLATYEQAGMAWHPYASMTRAGLADLLLVKNEAEEAEALLRQAAAALTQHLGADGEATLSAHYGLGMVLQRRGAHSEAAEHLRLALDGQVRKHGAVGLPAIAARHQLALALEASGDRDGAERQWATTFEGLLADETAGEEHLQRAADELLRLYRAAEREADAAGVQTRLAKRLGR